MSDAYVPPELTQGRTVVWISAGAASAVAGKLTLAVTPDAVLAYTDTGSEHPDNLRFLADLEAWYGRPIERLHSERYSSTWQVWEERRFIVSPQGALCTAELKRRPRFAFERPDDIQVFGYTSEEAHRAERFRQQNPEVTLATPLIERGLTKADCLAMIERARITLPAMYLLGYRNNNCFAAETEFITDRGVKRLGDMAGQSLRVRGVGGHWKDAEVRSFGVQPLMRVVLRRGAYKRDVYATPGHRWLVKPSAHAAVVETTTTGLTSGARLPSVFGRVGARVRPSAFGIAQGIVYGDGTRGNTLNTAATLVLCGEKDRELLRYFPLSPTTEVPAGVQVKDLPRHWKDAPRLDDAQSFLYGWLAGYFAADGHFSDGSAVLSSASRESLETARDVATMLGIGCNPIRAIARRGYGSAPTMLYSLPLISSTLREDFFLISAHSERFTASKRREPHPWFVDSVEPTDRLEEVFCAVVPDGNAFTLEGNVLTGNCVGCPKGGMGYWNMIRRDFPATFDRMAALERELGHSTQKDENGPVWLDELDPTRGDIHTEPDIECSLLCSLAESEVAL